MEECDNCGRPSHTTIDCFSKGSGKEAEAPWKKKEKKTKAAMVATVKDKDNDFFAFTCTSDYADIDKSSKFPKSRYGTCINSGASNDYSPDWTKFSNYREIERSITTADGRTLKAMGMSNLHINLLNGSKCTPAIFKNAVHIPEMAFTLLSASLTNLITKWCFIKKCASYQIQKDVP